MEEWSNNDCLELIDIYEQYPVLWKARHPFHYSKVKKSEAWDEIAQKLGRDASAVKQKMTSLLGSFRAQKSKGRKTIGTGKARREVYISKWFAFERMHFLLDKDRPKDTLDTENDFSESTLNENEGENRAISEDLFPVKSEEAVLEETDSVVDTQQVVVTPQRSSAPLSKKSRNVKEKEDSRIQEAFHMLKDAHTKFTASQSHQSTINSDRFSIYGQHVANKLRTYSQRAQAIVEHSINNILFEADMGNFDRT